MLRQILFLLLPLLLGALELPNLSYNGATESRKFKHETYNKLEVWTNKGYVSHYGESWAQSYRHPSNLADHDKTMKQFFAKQFTFDVARFDKSGYAEFDRGQDHYFLKLDTYAASYSYVLLRVTPYPKVVTLPGSFPYKTTKGKDADIPENKLIPEVTGFAILRAKYHKYDELTWYYRYGGESKHIHKGQYWAIDFSKTDKNTNSFRYMSAHDYKAQITAMGAQLLQDKDESFYFKLGETIGKFNSYENTYSIELVQEEAFKQALILTPDAIKAELDKTGKITLDGIYFDFDKATLKSESRKAILSAVALMERYSDLELSVHGYTDSKGNDAYNLTLSQNRAKAVMDAIIAEGIASSRLVYRGHGEEDPVADNNTDEGRAQNRRVELHKERGGDKQSLITIDFIKPIEGSVITGDRTYQNDELGIQFSKPYSEKNEHIRFKGTYRKISYDIMKDGKRDDTFARKAIIKNYENVIELYNAKIVGEYSNTLYFKIEDRGDGKSVYGAVEGYTGSYNIDFLIEE